LQIADCRLKEEKIKNGNGITTASFFNLQSAIC